MFFSTSFSLNFFCLRNWWKFLLVGEFRIIDTDFNSHKTVGTTFNFPNYEKKEKKKMKKQRNLWTLGNFSPKAPIHTLYAIKHSFTCILQCLVAKETKQIVNFMVYKYKHNLENVKFHSVLSPIHATCLQNIA